MEMLGGDDKDDGDDGDDGDDDDAFQGRKWSVFEGEEVLRWLEAWGEAPLGGAWMRVSSVECFLWGRLCGGG
jgi:hypothetical protein